MDTLFRIAHSSNFNTSIQAMLLIQQLVATKSFSADRFYRVLYESLLDPRLPASSKHAMYLNLLLRALKADVNTRRVKAFIKRMLQGLVLHQPPFACGVLYVLSQLRKTLPGLLTLIEEPEEHQAHAETRGTERGGADGSKGEHYDGRKRDPEYSNAHNTCLWEIVSRRLLGGIPEFTLLTWSRCQLCATTIRQCWSTLRQRWGRMWQQRNRTWRVIA